MPRNLASKALQKAIGLAHVDLDRDLRNTALIAGSGRSGTTWLAQVLNHDHRYRYLFEPLHPGRLRIEGLPAPNGYLRPRSSQPAASAAMRRVFEGRVRGFWVDGFNRSILARRRLVKDVWANLLLEWILGEFPEIPIVFIIRNPFAVTRSRLIGHRARGTWVPQLDNILGQTELVDDHLKDFRETIDAVSRGDDLFRKIFLQWCVENYVPLRAAGSPRIAVGCYEHLLLDPERELPRLFSHLGDEFEPAALHAVSVASPMHHPDSAVVTGGDLFGTWRADIEAEQIASGVELLKTFGLDAFYRGGDLPEFGAGGSVPLMRGAPEAPSDSE